MSDDVNIGGAPTGDDDADDAVLDELRTLAALQDPVPTEAIAAARSAIAWRTIDAELAELTADSLVDPALAGVRGATMATLLSFEASNLSVDVEIVEDGSRRRLIGQLVPPAPGSVEVRHASGTVRVTADEVGRFSVGDIAAGPVSLRCTAGSGPEGSGPEGSGPEESGPQESATVETDWFLA